MATPLEACRAAALHRSRPVGSSRLTPKSPHAPEGQLKAPAVNTSANPFSISSPRLRWSFAGASVCAFAGLGNPVAASETSAGSPTALGRLAHKVWTAGFLLVGIHQPSLSARNLRWGDDHQTVIVSLGPTLPGRQAASFRSSDARLATVATFWPQASATRCSKSLVARSRRISPQISLD